MSLNFYSFWYQSQQPFYLRPLVSSILCIVIFFSLLYYFFHTKGKPIWAMKDVKGKKKYIESDFGLHCKPTTIVVVGLIRISLRIRKYLCHCHGKVHVNNLNFLFTGTTTDCYVTIFLFLFLFFFTPFIMEPTFGCTKVYTSTHLKENITCNIEFNRFTLFQIFFLYI